MAREMQVEDPPRDAATGARAESGAEDAAGLRASLLRNLASPNAIVREKALACFGDWLSSRTQVDESDLSKVWQGVLYCLWQTDKPIVAAELSKKIAVCLGGLVSAEVAVAAFKVLLSTMVGEWIGIEKKKLDRFRVLLRHCLSEIFRVLKAHGWDRNHILEFVQAFEACRAVDNLPASYNVNIFLAQVFVEELRNATPVVPETLRLLLEPFFALFSTSTDKIVLQNVRDAVFLPLLQDALAAKSVATDARCLGSLVLGLPLAGKFFELATSPSVGAASKRLLNQLYEDFSKSEGIPVERRASRRGKHTRNIVIASPASSVEQDGVRIVENLEVAGNLAVAEDLAVAASAEATEALSEADEKQSPAEPSGAEPSSPRLLRTQWKQEGVEKRVLRSNTNNNSRKLLLLKKDAASSSSPPSPSSCKRKRSSEDEASSDNETASAGAAAAGASEGCSSDVETMTTSTAPPGSKKVRFSLRNNIVWTPHRPLPPRWVRVPPSVTPRGSAMKAGVMPGPVQLTTAASPKKKAAKKVVKAARKSKVKASSKGKRRKSL